MFDKKRREKETSGMQKQTAGEKHTWAVMSSVCKAVTGAFMFIFARACVANGPVFILQMRKLA